jgi:hypothetical protein
LLADLKTTDAEGHKTFSKYFDEVNRLLAAHHLPAHVEPTDVEPWDAQMYGYSGLHYLRRLAAYVDSGMGLPEPGNADSSQDPQLDAYFKDVLGTQPGWLARLTQTRPKFRREFDHLIVHSDAEGFYLPQDFAQVLITDDATIPAGMVGSTPRLLSECVRLAQLLEIPSHVTKDSEELWEASDSEGEGSTLWERYGVESLTCVALQAACRRSLETGAAIVFT